MRGVMGLKRSKMRDFMARSQKVLEELWPATVVVDGKSYAAAGGSMRRGSAFAPGGEVNEKQFSVRVSRDILEQSWKIGTRLDYEFDGETQRLRVVEVSSNSGDVAWLFRCEGADES